MARRKTTASRTEIDSIQHRDTRANIPTEELREFVADEEREPKMVLYPRDPSLDPQLVWKGKDEQDQEDLAVPAVPVYIQEKIHPRAIIEDLRRHGGKREAAQLDLFSSFDGGLEFDELVDFYQHEQNWSNRLILGDSLLVMTSLAEKEGLKGKVQMIYVDPPYGIKFGSNWQVSTRKRNVRDGSTGDLTRQPEQIKAFRDTWQLGIHSYLAYLRDRLVTARELLTESGSIFVQIGDENVHLVRALLDEVFGSENFCGQIVFIKSGGLVSKLLASRYDFVLWYARDIESVKYRQLYLEKSFEEGTATNYSWLQLPDRTRRGMNAAERRDPTSAPAQAEIYQPTDFTSPGNPVREFVYEGKPYRQAWKTTLDGMRRLSLAERVHVARNSLRYVRRLDDFPVVPVTQLWTDTGTGNFTDDKIYVVQTGTKTVERCIVMSTDPGDLVLDPTCGSGTTAYVAEQWGRRWITIDTSRVAMALARTRLMAGRFPYYLLSDTGEGQAQELEIAGVTQSTSGPTTSDIRKGFVYRRVPHITLGGIANDKEIDEIHACWQEQLEPLRAKINGALGQEWEEWEIPRTLDENTPPHAHLAPADLQDASHLLAEWWELRRKRQEEIDASIARNSESEILYDQPYEDSKRIRVTGPFTVESLSPHRVLSADDERPRTETVGQRDAEANGGGFVPMILENIRKAGVQNTVRDERLTFDHVEPFAGEWLQAAGEYTDGSSIARRVAIALGPEHGTVGPETVKEAAKEALRGAGFDLLLVCGFAFDAHADETAKEFSPTSNGKRQSGFIAEEERQYGKLPVLLVRMNPDLAMGEDLLKTTGAGNLFMVFGEPDLDIERQPDGKLVVELRGVDVYDPTTGEIRSNTTDDIACWFIDTDYNDESFFVRHAYFTGADQPYERLKRALKAEIDEEAWSQLYSTTSRPFDPPSTGKIAVKVINHYGDEVLKVYSI